MSVLWSFEIILFVSFMFFSLYFISHGDQWALCHYEHMLWEWISMHRKSRKLFSQKSNMDSLTFCVVRVTSDRKCLWQYQLECKMGEGLNHLTERRRICIESCLLISHPRHQLPCHFVDGRLKTLLRAWASRVPCWLSIIKIFHDCRRCNDVVCMVKGSGILFVQL